MSVILQRHLDSVVHYSFDLIGNREQNKSPSCSTITRTFIRVVDVVPLTIKVIIIRYVLLVVVSLTIVSGEVVETGSYPNGEVPSAHSEVPMISVGSESCYVWPVAFRRNERRESPQPFRPEPIPVLRDSVNRSFITVDEFYVRDWVSVTYNQIIIITVGPSQHFSGFLNNVTKIDSNFRLIKIFFLECSLSEISPELAYQTVKTCVPRVLLEEKGECVRNEVLCVVVITGFSRCEFDVAKCTG